MILKSQMKASVTTVRLKIIPVIQKPLSSLICSSLTVIRQYRFMSCRLYGASEACATLFAAIAAPDQWKLLVVLSLKKEK